MTHSVLLISQDRIYIKAISIILKHVFKTQVIGKTFNDDLDIDDSFITLSRFIIFDLESYPNIVKEKLKEIKKLLPEVKLIALSLNEEAFIQSTNKVFDNIVPEKNFSEGFSELIKKPNSKAEPGFNEINENNKPFRKLFKTIPFFNRILN